MKSHFRNFVSITLFLLLLFSPISASATDTPNIYPTTAEYNLSSKEEQSFAITNSNNELLYITVTPLPTIAKTENGSYRITYTQPGYWSANFILSISNNKITDAHSPAATAISGYISNYMLHLDSSTQASLRILWKPLHSSPLTSVGMKAYLTSTNTLKVSPL